MSVKTPGELDAEHFRRLDVRQLELAEETKRVEIKAKWKAEEQRAITERKLIEAKIARRKWWRYFLAWISAPILTAALVWGGTALWGHKGPLTPDEAKQERWKQCVKDTDIGGSPTHVWFPEEQGGQGLCLPRGQNPPGK